MSKNKYTDKKVNKASNAEVMSVVDNIQALIEQLISMGAMPMGEGGGMMGMDMENKQMPMDDMSDPNMMKQMPMEKEGYDMKKQQDQTDRPPMDEEEITKAVVDTMSDGAPANEDAEERIDDNLPDPSMENVMEIAKALATLVQKRKAQKAASVNNNFNPELIANAIQKSLQPLVARQQETEKALENILQGLGVAKSIEETAKVEKEQKQVRNYDELYKIVDIVTKSVEKNRKTEEPQQYRQNNLELARKSTKNLLTGLITKDK